MTQEPEKTAEPTATPATEKQTEKGTAVDVSKTEKKDNSGSNSGGTVTGKATIIAAPAQQDEKLLSVAVEDTIPSEKQAEAKTVAESVKTDNVIADKAKEFVNDLTPAQTEQLKKTAGLPGNVTLQAKAHLEVKAKDIVTENGATTSIAMDITPMVQIVASNETETVVVQKPEELTVNAASKVTVELPISFANKTVYITHDTREKGGELNYYYARADENGKLTFISEHGFSPFVFSLTKTEPVNNSSNIALSRSEAAPAPAVVQMSIALPKTGDMTILQSILSFFGVI